MATILAGTDRITVFPDVANLPLRPSALLAKSAASLDVLSGGRFELGLGAGAFWEPIAAMGGPRRTRRQAATALAEAVDVVRLMWSDHPSVRYAGEIYQLAGVRPGPGPAHDMGIWLGVGGPKLLDLLGRTADGWVPSNSYFPPEKLPGMHAVIDQGAESAGRDPCAIHRLYNVFGTITEGPSHGPFDGPVEQWVEELTGLAVDGGMDSFVFAPGADPARQIELFAAGVAPAVREAVAEQRDGR